MDNYCSPEYNEHSTYELWYLANQKPWLPYFWNNSEKQTKCPIALSCAHEYQ